MTYQQGDSVLLEELRVAEEELRVQNEELVETQFLAAQERDRYRTLFERAPIPYLVTNADGTIREANCASGTLLHYRPERLIGKPLAVFIATRTRSAFRTHVRALASTGDVTTVPLTIVPRQGPERFVNATAEAVHDRDGALREIRWLLAGQARVAGEVPSHEGQAARIEHTEGALRRMTDLVAWVSHELRTPAASIGGYAEMLAIGARGTLTPEQQAVVARMQGAQAHLVSLLDDLLTLTQVSGGHFDCDVTDSPIEPLLERLLIIVHPQAAMRDIRLCVTATPGLVIRADPERSLQILLNILMNAVKFTPASGTVSVHCEADGTNVLLRVTDSGPGIAPELRERVFEPYVQLTAAVDARARGVGLGLAISRDLARAMGGELTCADADICGSVFVLRLPRSMGIATS